MMMIHIHTKCCQEVRERDENAERKNGIYGGEKFYMITKKVFGVAQKFPKKRKELANKSRDIKDSSRGSKKNCYPKKILIIKFSHFYFI